MIDSHHHFWKYSPAEYGWIGEDMMCLRRNFLPADFKAEIDRAGVTGVVSVQARQTPEETRWLLQLAEQTEWMQGVVGWVPLASARVEAALEEFSGQPKLKGVRHVVQGEADGFLEGAEFNRGISLLPRFGLVYDLLIFERQLKEAIEFVDRHPQQVFVLDHIAKPRIEDGVWEPWRTQIRELARRENVSCKVSGIVTEAGWHSWTVESIQPYFEVVLEAFGPSRILFGSDWPVCLVACGYQRWAGIVRGWAGQLSEDERADFLGRNAARIYGLA